MIAIYVRDAQGLVEYFGPQDWDSREQCLEHFNIDPGMRQVESMLGWPHLHVEWFGPIGFGIGRTS